MTAAGTADVLTIGQVAARTGVAVDTVRYYERAGLLPTPARTTGEHRRYGAAAGVVRNSSHRSGRASARHLGSLAPLLPGLAGYLA